MQTIGILGGMGPQASIRTYELIIDLAIREHGADANDRFPYILLANIPVPDLIGDTSHQQKTIGMVRESALALRAAGADFLIMPCNTMHLFVRDIFADDLPFVSMIESVVMDCLRSGFRKVGILGSPTSLRSGLYQSALESRGIVPIAPAEEKYPTLLTCIQSVIAGDIQARHIAAIGDLVAELQFAGAEAVILGCTELPLLARELRLGIPLLDSPLSLARAAAARAYS